MKTISIKQPWASLIAHGIKDIENRTWKTNYRGRVLIHASTTKDNRKKPLLTDEQYSLVGGVSGYGKHIFGELGAVIGSVEIIDCSINHPSVWAERTEVITDESDGIPTPCYGAITYNYVLANPVLFEKPIIGVKGKLGLWNYPIAEIMSIDELSSECGYFTSQTDANNGYGCNHPDQEEFEMLWEDENGYKHRGYDNCSESPKTRQGKCYSFSCPIANRSDTQDLFHHAKELYDEIKRDNTNIPDEDLDEIVMDGEFMLVYKN